MDCVLLSSDGNKCELECENSEKLAALVSRLWGVWGQLWLKDDRRVNSLHLVNYLVLTTAFSTAFSTECEALIVGHLSNSSFNSYVVLCEVQTCVLSLVILPCSEPFNWGLYKCAISLKSNFHIFFLQPSKFLPCWSGFTAWTFNLHTSGSIFTISVFFSHA